MKILLAQIYCLIRFGFDSKKLEKMLDAVYKHHAVVCISIFDVAYKFNISGPKYLFLWCLFLAIKWVQNGVNRNGGVFLL